MVIFIIVYSEKNNSNAHLEVYRRFHYKDVHEFMHCTC